MDVDAVAAFETLRGDSATSGRWFLTGTRIGFGTLCQRIANFINQGRSKLLQTEDGNESKYAMPNIDRQLPDYLPGCLCFVRSLRRHRDLSLEELATHHNQAVIILEHPEITGDCSKRCRVGTLMGKRKKVYLIRPENLYIGAFRPENPYIGALQHNALKQELENLSRQWFVKFVDPDTGARRDGLLYPPKMNRKGVWEGKCLVEPLQEGREIGSTDPAQLVTVEPKHIEFDVERSGVSKSRRDIDDTASLGKGSKTTEFSELSRTPHISDGRPN